jgi:arginase
MQIRLLRPHLAIFMVCQWQALLGKADKKLAAMYPSHNFIRPENLILIGVRNYEKEEFELLKQANVEIIYANQIDGLSPVLINAMDKLSHTCQAIGISIDLDVVDPEEAPGVETPAEGGIKASELLTALRLINRQPKVCGLELSEFTHEKDINNKTLYLMKALIEAFYAEPSVLDSNKPNKFLGSLSSGIKGNSVPM